MKHSKIRELFPVHKTWFLNFVLVGLSLAAASGVLVQGVQAQNAQAQNAGGKPPAVTASPEAMMALEQRVKNLEGQISDLRTMIGTISSLRQRPDLGQRSDLGRSARSIEPGQEIGRGARARSSLGSGIGPMVGPPSAVPGASPMPRFGAPTPHLAGRTSLKPSLPSPRPNVREDGFGSDRTASRGRQSLQPQSGPPAQQTTEPVNTQDAQKLYNDAYSHMLRRDYASAEKAFNALVNTHPGSRMAGNAQYWLGETYFVRGKYRPAADAFLKAYRNYSNGVKAPDSLMKLALSLNKLGQTSAACKTFDELASKYPNAPNHVKQRAGMEQRRAGCN